MSRLGMASTASILGEERPASLARLQRFADGFPPAAATGALLLAVVTAAGWLVGQERLASIVPGMPTTKIATAGMIVMLGLCLLALRRVGRFKVPITTLSATVLVGSVYFLANPVNRPGDPALLLAPSLVTSLTLALLALACCVRLYVKSAWPIALLLVLASLLPLHRLVTFVVGHGTVHTTGPFDSMSIPTSFALYLLAGGFFLDRDLPYAKQLSANTLQGRLLRITLPWTLFAPPVLAVMMTLGVHWELYDTKFVVAATTAVLSALMTVLLWLLTTRLQSSEDERVAAYRDLSLSERYANQLIEASQDAMLAVDNDGKIARANAQAEKLFGYDAARLSQMSIGDLMPERFRERHVTYRRHFFAHPEARAMGQGRDLLALRSDGSEVPVEVALTPLESVYGPMVLANVIDITERLTREEQMRNALEEKTLLLNEVHHRGKNNLQIVASLLSLQAGAVRDPSFNKLIAESEGRVRAMALLHQILYERKDFSHVELDVYLQRLADLQMQIHHSFVHRVRMQVDCVRLRMNLDQAIPLGQIVNELLSNAFKHAFGEVDEGLLSLTLSALPKGRARLVVSDNGPGFSHHGGETGGTGLGMQLIELLSEQIGADLTFAKPPGGRVELSFAVLSEQSPEPGPAQQQPVRNT